MANRAPAYNTRLANDLTNTARMKCGPAHGAPALTGCDYKDSCVQFGQNLWKIVGFILKKIYRKNNENVALMSLNEYNSLMETNYLLSSKTNAEHLQRSINQHKTGRIKERKLCEDE